MRIVIGADHAGFELKRIIADYLRKQGHEIIDKGTDSDKPVDYQILPRQSAKHLSTARASAVCSSAAAVWSVSGDHKLPGITRRTLP